MKKLGKWESGKEKAYGAHDLDKPAKVCAAI